MAYAKRLTKERLIQEGFTEITKEGRVFKGEHEIFPSWNGKENNPNRYLCISVYKRDSVGNPVRSKDRVYKYTRKDGTVREYVSWDYEYETFGLHRVVWAWHYGEVPEGMVVDHVNNQHFKIEDYHLDNLQLLTPKDNITKERICNVKEIPCKLDRPRTYYVDKLAKYEKLYEQAKANKNVEEAHKLRTNVAQTKARLRYYDSHIEEANKLTEFKKDLMELGEWKKTFKENGNKHNFHECCTIEKMVRELGIEAWPVVKHALEVAHKFFGKEN